MAMDFFLERKEYGSGGGSGHAAGLDSSSIELAVVVRVGEV